ncbi:LysR family transcriptional regulator [Sulfitobacter sp. SK012]|uniref:LysR family transcriptional regulator n=1 Tax=Sulfitobacter sp. SK012 TaxID=1389005 RepID=UPI000E0C6800|nr:LysR family transcriptional regulator [Sulfitobacter sp. SK012]AXI44995.1 LysR family transcriptional regulator [Sulfitobacter sp. SK012]
MDWKELPPLSALRSFAAFAENGSVIAAGDALGVSHAAISQQLRALEGHMGVPLLDRSGRALRITPEGEVLARALKTGFGGVADAVAELTGARDARPLHVSVTPTFAASWLMPRLAGFRHAHPEIDLMIDPTPEVVTLGPDGIDVALRNGEGPWPGLETELLLSSTLVVVGAPSLVGDGPVPPVEALAQLPWLDEFGRSESSMWLQQYGFARSARGLAQVPGNLMLDGARDGQGLAVTVRMFVERDIAAGRLRVLHEAAQGGTGYHIVTRAGVMRPPLKAFVSWLRCEAAASMKAVDV